MKKVKTERNLKVYRYESKWYDYPAEIRLKGNYSFGSSSVKMGCDCSDSRIK